MPSEEVQALYDQWGKETVQKAFWLQSKIKREGLDGINFLHDEGTGRSGESRAKSTKHMTTKSTIEGELKNEY